MKVQLVLVVVTFVLAFRIDSEKGCETGSLNRSYLMDCSDVDKSRSEFWREAIKLSEDENTRNSKQENEFLDKYDKNFRSSQCVKIVTAVDDSGSKTDRVFRGCTGLVCKGQTLKGKCLKVGTDPRVKGQQCYCESDECNSTHRRLHPNNFWLNILLPIIISLSFVFNFY